MFLGEYQHNIDPKGRLIIPAKFREDLGEQFVLSKGLDGCLFVYPLKEWQELENKLRSLPLTQKDARAFARTFFSGANEAELDKQGRVLLAAYFKKLCQNYQGRHGYRRRQSLGNLGSGGVG